jgi:RNA polymerase sigma factor (sigma-70 family)
MQKTDKILVERYVQTGDVEAYAEIVKLHSGMVFAVCSRVLRDQARAEDVCQETFLHLLQKADTVKGSLSCWLHTTATWKAIDVIRQDSSRKKREAGYVAEKSEEDSTWGEISPYIDQALAKLPEQEKRLLIEHFLEGKSQICLAEEEGVSQTTISRKVDGALKKVRKHLEKSGVAVGAVALLSFFSTNMVEAASPHLVVELGKMTILAGAKATLSKTISILTISKITLGIGILGIGLGLFFSSVSNVPSRSELRSVHYTAQSRNNDPNAPSSTSKGAYEQWFYFPEGADGPVMMRMQRWDPKMTVKMCRWLQNADGNYYYHAGEQKLYITNYRLWLGGLHVRRLPTDTPALVDRINEIEGPISGVDHVRDPTTGYLVSATDHRFVDAPKFKTDYEYDTLTEDFFNYNWASTVEVVDLRDSIHRQGWAYFYVEGQIGDEKIEGTGRLPLVYREVKDHSAWLNLKLGQEGWIIDCRDCASYQSNREKTSCFPGGHFFRGLARPWMGMHTIDIIRRDAIECGISFTLDPMEDDERDVEITLMDDHDYAHTRITYRIDMENDLIESISFLADIGGGRPREGQIRFSYFDKLSQIKDEFVEPAITDPASSESQRKSGTLWLLDLARGHL